MKEFYFKEEMGYEVNIPESIVNQELPVKEEDKKKEEDKEENN